MADVHGNHIPLEISEFYKSFMVKSHILANR